MLLAYLFKLQYQNNGICILTCGFLVFSITYLFCIIGRSSNIHNDQYHLPKLNLQDVHLLTQHEVDSIESTHTNLPLKYWIQVKKQTKLHRMNSTCAQFPNLLELDITHTFWQTARFSNATLQLFNAYYDQREFTPGMNIRIPCMINRNETLFKTYCQMWFDGETQPTIVKVEKIHYMWVEAWHMHAATQYGPYLIECKIPESHKEFVPKAVSIVEKPCDNARNLMKVQYVEVPEVKKNFTVCVKGLDFLEFDFSARLVEWLELLFELGADKVHMYNLHVHPNMRKVIDYYQNLGKVDCKPITLPEGQTNFPVLQHMYLKKNLGQQCLNEIIPYNDCFYRNINLYNYVVILDVDEVIMPQKDYDWNGLIKRALNHSKPGELFASLDARNVYFLDDMMPEGIFPDIPPYMHIMQHVYRSVNFTRPRAYVKSFFHTDYVLTCHNHYPLISSPKVLHYFAIDTEEAHMQHYRAGCVPEVDCNIFRNHIVKDTSAWKYKDVLISRVNKVLEDIHLLE